MTIDPKLDLVLDRTIAVPTDRVWDAWTTPEQLKQWFVPKPWMLADCELDVRPGGIFKTVMRSPDGDGFTGVGCFLEVVPGRRLSWTTVLHPGYRPSPEPGDMPFTAIITMEPAGSGTRYVATVIHRDEAGRAQHEAMGFHQGWGAALDQLVALLGD